jgi:hypothetical protein
MIGDHRGRSAGRATLLVRAVDAILGTHRHTGESSPGPAELITALPPGMAAYRRIAKPSIAQMRVRRL